MSDIGDCRSENGVTIGLIDSIISVARILRHRDFNAPQINEALLDLRSDEDIQFLLGYKSNSEQPERREDIQNLKDVSYETLEVLEDLLIQLRYGTVVNLNDNENMLDIVSDLRRRLTDE